MFHMLEDTELWHFHMGAPLVIHQIADGEIHSSILGSRLDGTERLFLPIPPGRWFAAESTGNYSLVGCTVVPGFEFERFRLGTFAELSPLAPSHSSLIRRLTPS